MGLQHIAEEEGLPDNYIYSLVQDQEGYLWLSTGKGILRYNGLDLSALALPDSFPDPKVVATYLQEDGSMWLGHFDGGVTVLRNGVPEIVYQDDAFNTRIVGLTSDAQGNIWVASQRSGLLRVAPDGQTQRFREQLEGSSLFSLEKDDQGNLLLGSDEGLVQVSLSEGKPDKFQNIPSIPGAEVPLLHWSPDRKHLWVGLREFGLYRMKNSESGLQAAQAVAFAGPVAPRRMVSALETPDDMLWLGTEDQGLLLCDLRTGVDTLSPLSLKGLPSPLKRTLVPDIERDRFGQIWLGTYGKGLYCFGERTLSAMGTGEEGTVNCLAESADHYWLGTDQGLLKVSRSQPFESRMALGETRNLNPLRKWTTAEGLPSNQVSALTVDAEGNVWIGTRQNGLAMLSASDGRVSQVDFSPNAANRRITGLLPLPSGKIWVATFDGVFLYDPDEGTSNYFGTQNGLSHNHCYDLLLDQKGRTWFTTHTSLVSVYENGEIDNVRVSDTGEVASINCVLEDEQGILWFGADGGGLYRYEGEQFRRFTRSDGLLSDFVDRLLTDPAGHIWAVHREGLSRYVPGTDSIRAYPFSRYLGMEEQEILAALTDKEGNLLIGGEKKLLFHPFNEERSRTQPPTISILKTDLLGKDRKAVSGTELPYFDGYRLQVEFEGLAFYDQDLVTYQHRLLGRDSSWSASSLLTTAIYSGLKDGEYTFQVRATNGFGRTNKTPASFAFTVLPPFWKTWWFRITMVAALGLLIYLYGRYRVLKLRKEKEELEQKVQERTFELQSEKKKLEQANLELEKLSLVASETDNAVLIFDEKGKLEWLNDGFSRLTGYSREEINEMKLGQGIDMTPGSQSRQLIDQVVESQSSVQYESQLPTKGGDPLWVISTLTPILDDAGNLRKIVIIDLDISDRKVAEEEVKRVNEKLEQLVEERTLELAQANEQLQVENEEHIKTANQLTVINRELDQFVYRASHDLKGPLASLMGLFDIARGDLSDNPVATRYLDLMEKSGKRLDNVLVDLIEVTQVKQGKTEMEVFSPSEMVREIFELLKDKPGYEKMVFRQEVRPDLQLVSDRKLVRSILQNFIENTAKYRDPAKETPMSTVRVELQGKEFLIEVEDNGIGVAEEHKDKVFQMFFRATHTAGGSGLGLYIVKQAVEKLGGSVEMESEEGKGTVMRARIPNQPVPETEPS